MQVAALRTMQDQARLQRPHVVQAAGEQRLLIADHLAEAEVVTYEFQASGQVLVIESLLRPLRGGRCCVR
jgi:hypothetical protein